MQTEVDFHSFFPNEFDIKKIDDSDHKLLFHLESTSTSAICPHCGGLSSTIHGKRYRKNISDLPFLDWPVNLNITLNEYNCPHCHIYFVENPDSFLLERKSISARCEKYLSDLKRSLDGSTTDTTALANYAHIPLNRGVVRYVPVDIGITNSDQLWILDFVKQNYPATLALKRRRLPSALAKEMLQKIHCNCEKALHPNLVTLSVYDLNCIISENKNSKEKEDKELPK